MGNERFCSSNDYFYLRMGGVYIENKIWILSFYLLPGFYLKLTRIQDYFVVVRPGRKGPFVPISALTRLLTL